MIMYTLFGYIVPMCSICIIVLTAKEFSKNGIVSRKFVIDVHHKADSTLHTVSSHLWV